MAKIANYVKVGIKGKFNISPSSIALFQDNAKVFYDRNILGTDKFTGNTNTVLGSVVHAAIEQHNEGGTLGYDDIALYLEQYLFNGEVNMIDVSQSWEEMFEAYKAYGAPIPDKQEYQVLTELDDNLTLGGSVDAKLDTTIIDYKTCSTITKNMSIDTYKTQLMSYAYCEVKAGNLIDTLQIYFIQRPNKGHPSEKTGKIIGIKPAKVLLVEHKITKEDWKEFEEILTIMRKTLYIHKIRPDLADVLFRHNPYTFRQ